MTDIDTAARAANLALHHYKIGNFPAAIEQFKIVLSTNPNDAQAHAALAFCLYNMRRMPAAEHEAKIAIELDPQLDWAFRTKAAVSLTQQRYKQAMDEIEEALRLKPHDANSHFVKGQIHDTLDDMHDAVAAYETSLSIEPGDPVVLSSLAIALLELGDTGRAHTLALDALTANPESGDAHLALGRMALERNNVPGARDHCLTALRLDPEDTRAISLMASIKMRQNKLAGLWWRSNEWSNKLSESGQVIVLIVLFAGFNFAMIYLEQNGMNTVVNFSLVFWLLLGIYLMGGTILFRRSIMREIDSVTIKPKY